MDEIKKTIYQSNLDHDDLLADLSHSPTGSLAARYQREYARLQALPRKQRRSLQKSRRMSLVGIALTLALGVGLARPRAVRAATITVDGTTCTLVDAITAANSDSAAGGCTAGSGADTINLQSDVSLTSVNNGSGSSATGLPVITSQITIEGNAHTVARDSGAPQFRILNIANGGNLTINQATISGGNINGSGGGIYNNMGGTGTLNDITVNGNAAAWEGGGISNRGTLTLNNSTVSGNSTSVNGGGIFLYAGNTTLNNSTVSGNTSTRGGGIDAFSYFTPGSLNLNRSLVAGNNGSSGANEVFAYSKYGTFPINAANYNLFGHSGESNAQAFIGFMPSGSDITATSNGTNATALTSILNTTLADNGGPTLTHALVSGSPASEVIPTTDAACNPGSTVDQRGAARANGVNQGGSACDIGAFEYGSSQTPTAVTMQSFSAETAGDAAPRGGVWAALVGAASMAAGGLWLRFKRRATR